VLIETQIYFDRVALVRGMCCDSVSVSSDKNIPFALQR
jgi:hypothetical protein